MALTPRETAHRVFAVEFNASRVNLPGEGEKDPSYLLTPLGAKVNRLHVVGVLTDVERIGESQDQVRARISDPTGVFTVYAGQYQPEAAQALAALEPPCYVAVTGKARTYEPEPGTVFVSIRPESVVTVDAATRDQWILDTARRTTERLEATQAVRDATRGGPDGAGGIEPPSIEALRGKGVRTTVAEGARLAHTHYSAPPQTGLVWSAVRKSVGYLLPGGEVPVHRDERQGRGAAPSSGDADGSGAYGSGSYGSGSHGPSGGTWSGAAGGSLSGAASAGAFASGGMTTVNPGWKAAAPASPAVAAANAAAEAAKQKAEEELEERVLAIVKKLEGSRGAAWDDILTQAATGGVTSDQVDETLNRLMDKGLVYEPTLGILKTT